MKPDAFKILSQAIEDGAFAGGEIFTIGDFAASYDDDKNLIAIADAGGWWAIPIDVLRAITDLTPKLTHD